MSMYKDNPMQSEKQFGELCPKCWEYHGTRNFVDVPENFSQNDVVVCKYGHALTCEETNSDFVDVRLRA